MEEIGLGGGKLGEWNTTGDVIGWSTTASLSWTTEYEVSDRGLRVGATRYVIRAPQISATVDLPNQGEAMRVWKRMRAGSLVLSVAGAAAIAVAGGGDN
jgi:hypothetical protein